MEGDVPSRSTGTPAAGKLENGRRLPTSGPNYIAYSRLGVLLGRNSVNEVIRDVVVDTYKVLAESEPHLTFVYGETGWPRGGPFPPHRTHQNGLSVDFMVPVLDENGHSGRLPTAPWRMFGYGLKFDERGHMGSLQIDFDAMAAHLTALDSVARAHGTRIELLILAPEYHPLLWQTGKGESLQGRFPVKQESSWVRHDNHYHVDFANPDG
ncbi:MAG: penicillin-insensitive murein endopeptidase [Candidatus Krumholzibacteriota bacterium]|nr:penicillin-insensitive murein endopeptidase [Candidatus Krumholzibacteriota bacterium]